MQPEPLADWPDWTNRLSSDSAIVAEDSMRELARYANPEMLAMLGIGAAEIRQGDDYHPAKVAQSLASQLRDRSGGYTIEPFSAAGHRSQIIRTPSELLQGAGTCVDFAVAVAAGCVREDVPVYLCIVVPEEGSASHAFLALPPTNESAGSGIYEWLGTAEFAAKVPGADGFEIVDPTPGPAQADALLRGSGVVHIVSVQNVVKAGRQFYKPPANRSLGITTLLPDLPELRTFDSRAELVAQLQEASGTVVVVWGDAGVGKSTLALLRAHDEASSRGWFLDGSDREALQQSLAAAEAQCRGESLDNIQKENVASLSADARHRLAVANQPWVVVIDNADGPIGPVADLIPRPGPGQLVIVTSTNPEWEKYADDAGWTPIPVGRLDKDRDLSEDERSLPLPGSLLLPGILRLSRAAAARAPGSLGEQLDVPRLLRILFGERAGLIASLPADTVAASLLAAAFMPPEDVRQDWLSSCVPSGAEVPRVLEHLAAVGVLETSRRIRDARTPDRRTFWLHRIIRAAVIETYADITQPAVQSIMCRVLRQEPKLEPRTLRSQADLFMLAEQLEEAMSCPADPGLPEAIVTILDTLEPRGGADVNRAAALASESLTLFPAEMDDDWRLRAIPMQAIARGVFRDGMAGEDDLARALAVCDELISRLAGDESGKGKLVRGRTEAIRALLLRKRASRLLKAQDYGAAIPLLEEIIEVLIQSFEDRSQALGWQPPALRPPQPCDGETAAYRPFLGDDPDRHVDRAWFNVGGANIDLAKAVLNQPASAGRRSRLGRHWSDALWGYAGSLWLRREDTMYRAASLWGVALTLYMAALNGAYPLDLSCTPRSEAIDDLWGRQDREVLLTVAERCAAQAHAIRVRIAGPRDGDAKKTRDIGRKIAVAWDVTEPTADQAEAAGQRITASLREDTGLPAAGSDPAGRLGA